MKMFPYFFTNILHLAREKLRVSLSISQNSKVTSDSETIIKLSKDQHGSELL